MSTHRRQLGALLRTALRLDLRSRGALRARRTGHVGPFVWMALFYAILSLSTALGLESAGASPLVFAALLFGIMSTLVLFNILVEYQEILMAPADGDVLFWRPIASRTLFLAKTLHILVYVGFLTAVMLLGPTLVLVALHGRPALGVVPAFWLAGCLANLTAAAFTVVLYGWLLRRIAAERVQDVLTWVQLVFSIFVVLGSQLLGGALIRLGDLRQPGFESWLHLWPAAWFAALPAMAAGGFTARLAGLFGLGVAVFVGLGVYALQRLAPAYEISVAQMGAAAAPAAGPAGRRRRLDDLVGRRVARAPLARAGFDFFLANLRGDRRVKVSLMPNVGLPLAMVLYAFLAGQTTDPYAAARAAGAADAGRDRSVVLAPAPGAEVVEIPVADRPAASQLFLGVYFLGLLGVTLTRAVAHGSAWRAGWIFYAAPLQRFDRFYAGVVWGIAYGLVLPGALLVAVALLVAWRQPLHVAAHLALPTGIALVSLPLALAFDVAPPFSREPVRHARMRDILVMLLAMVPISGVAVAHYALRAHVWLLIAAGALLAAASLLVWRRTSRRLCTLLLHQPFGG